MARSITTGMVGAANAVCCARPHAYEVINLFSLAIRHDLSVGDVKTTVFAYPTAASDIGYML